MLNQDGKNLTGNQRFKGYCADLAEQISKLANFTYEIRLVKDGRFGVKGRFVNYKNLQR